MKPLRQFSGRLGEVLAASTAGARQATRDCFQELRRVDKKLEIAFCQLIGVVLLLSAPVLALLGVLLGMGIGTFLAFFYLLKYAFRKRRSNKGTL